MARQNTEQSKVTKGNAKQGNNCRETRRTEFLWLNLQTNHIRRAKRLVLRRATRNPGRLTAIFGEPWHYTAGPVKSVRLWKAQDGNGDPLATNDLMSLQ
jgi:hypothetical protein